MRCITAAALAIAFVGVGCADGAGDEVGANTLARDAGDELDADGVSVSSGGRSSGGAGGTSSIGAGGASASSSGGRSSAGAGGELASGGTPANAGGASLGSGGGGGSSCLPLDMFFLVDTSGSMDQDSKWTSVSTALVGFLNDPVNADVGVGVAYFPKVFPGVPVSCTLQADCANYGPCVGGIPADFIAPGALLGGNCQGADFCGVPEYAAPSVPISLPANPGAVVADIQRQSPAGGTPTRPALEGAMQYVTAHAQQNPGRSVVLVLATDGQPTGCQANTPQDVASIADAALNGPNRIRTFVIGVGSSLQDLNLVAQAGGSTHAYIVDTGADVAAQFTQALLAIRGQVVPCEPR